MHVVLVLEHQSLSAIHQYHWECYSHLSVYPIACTRNKKTVKFDFQGTLKYINQLDPVQHAAL